MKLVYIKNIPSRDGITSLVDEDYQYARIYECPRWISPIMGNLIVTNKTNNNHQVLFAIPPDLFGLKRDTRWPLLLLALLNNPNYRTHTQTWLNFKP